MAQVTPYTTTDAIRACLGIDKEDCPEEMIVDSRLELELLVDLDSWLPDHSTIYDTGVSSGAAATDVLHKNWLLLYSQWFGAFEMASRFLMFPQIVTDGKNQMNRFSNVELDKVKDLAASRMAKYRAALDEAVNGSTTSTLSVLRVSVPDYDPVTNT